MRHDRGTKRVLKAATAVLITVSGLATAFGGIASATGGVATAPSAVAHVSAPMSTTLAIAVLAHSGIATVATEGAISPVEAVSAGVGMRFTEAQVAAMAVAASNHSGITGSTLDDTVPVSKGEPPFSYLLAAWVSTGTSSGATAVRDLMGSQLWTDAPALVFPAIALPLFSADAMTAVGVPPAAKSTAPAKTGDGPAQVRGTALAAMGLFSTPCSTVTNFIQEVLDTVFENLKLSAPTGSSVVAKVGSFFVNLWDIAVSLAKTVVSGLTKAVGESVVRPIVAIAGAAATMAEVVSYIMPWSATVTAVPSSVAMGGNPGSFKAMVTSPLGISFPRVVQDCAQALHITLPSLTAKGAKATWTVAGPITPTSTTSPTLDAQGSNTLGYITGLVPCAQKLLPPADERGYATISVTRTGVSSLKTLVSNWVAGMVGPAGALVKPVLEPLLDNILSKLDNLTQVHATGTVTVTMPKGDEKSQTTCPCIDGKWRVVNETVTLAGLSGGAGATWSVVPDGADPADAKLTVDHNGSGPLGNSSLGLTVQYSGEEVDTFSIPPAEMGASSGTWTGRAVSGSVTATTTIGGKSTTKALPFDPGLTFGGTWTCQGDAMTASYAGVGETNTLTRTGS